MASKSTPTKRGNKKSNKMGVAKSPKEKAVEAKKQLDSKIAFYQREQEKADENGIPCHSNRGAKRLKIREEKKAVIEESRKKRNKR